MLLSGLWLQAQNTIHIKGRVLSESGQPVAKATVQVRGSKTGVSTDEAGNFEIVAASDATLMVSSIGYTATSIRVVGGKMLMTDGPFADTKEVLGGLCLIEAANLDEAIELAARIPAARLGGTVEVRPVVPR